ncbi:MAG: QacE family quaternary ammonium compound efflux SMR transporter [Labilithrix sp.]|nr:QacE family quaternary ammonium compound efflux SMR transporter [Labilithrix sp.]MCW5817092.1 QacE family quaternary ammonium compound efflux SMR transporter [Labilithrix sp.]
MAWFLLIVAGLLEVVWAYGLKRWGFSVLTLAAMGASILLLSRAMKTIPLGTAYTCWTGIGAVGALVVGVVALGESATASRIVAALLILTGLVLMK